MVGCSISYLLQRYLEETQVSLHNPSVSRSNPFAFCRFPNGRKLICEHFCYDVLCPSWLDCLRRYCGIFAQISTTLVLENCLRHSDLRWFSALLPGARLVPELRIWGLIDSWNVIASTLQ